MVNECEDCGSEFTTTRDLNQHVSSHGLGKIHECEDYGREFTTTSNLKQHVSSHGLGKIHECEDCGRAFTNRDSVILQNGQMKPRKNCSVEAKKNGQNWSKCSVERSKLFADTKNEVKNVWKRPIKLRRAEGKRPSVVS